MTMRGIYQAGFVILIGSAIPVLAQPSKGEMMAMSEVGVAWREHGLQAALNISGKALMAFPESVPVSMCASVLDETAGNVDAAYVRCERLKAAKGDQRSPRELGVDLTVREWCDAMQYRLCTQQGRMLDARSHFNALWRTAFDRWFGSDPDAVVWRELVRLESACLGAADETSHSKAFDELEAIEQALRATVASRPSDQEISLASLALSRCIFERRQNSEQSLGSKGSAEASTFPALPIEKLADTHQVFQMMAIPAGGPMFGMPSGLRQHPHAMALWNQAIGERSKHLALSGLCSHLAGIYALQRDDHIRALTALSTACSRDTWMRPVSAAVFARVAVAQTSKHLTIAADDSPAVSNVLERIRLDLSDELRRARVRDVDPQ